MIPATRIRKGMLIDYKGELWRVVYFMHLTPGNVGSVIQTKIKNLKTGKIIDERFKAADKIQLASLTEVEMEYLYHDGTNYVFMDTKTYDQTLRDEELSGDNNLYLKSNQKIVVDYYDDKPVGITLPKTVDLLVTECDPGLKAASVTNVQKPVTLETGLIVNA